MLRGPRRASLGASLGRAGDKGELTIRSTPCQAHVRAAAIREIIGVPLAPSVCDRTIASSRLVDRLGRLELGIKHKRSRDEGEHEQQEISPKFVPRHKPIVFLH